MLLDPSRASPARFDARGQPGRPAELSRRFDDHLPAGGAEYWIDGELFELRIPAGEDSCPRGLLVWISPGDRGAPPDSWLQALDRHGIVWVGADLAGNARNFWDRYALALDALENVRVRYRIDPARTYIGGFSGGGRCASALALVYGDLFAGGLFVCGCDAFLPVPIPSRDRSFWRPQFPAPGSQIRKKCQSAGRYVYLTGENDFNRDQTRSTAETMRKGGFSLAVYMEIPGLGHALPAGPDFERALAHLDPMF